jgi:hypothetical protein
VTADLCVVPVNMRRLITLYDKARGAGYLNRLQSEDLEGVDVGKWQQLQPLGFYSREMDLFIVTPAGAIANSYSVPLGFEWVVRGQDRRPAFTHDDAYTGQLQVCQHGNEPLRPIAISRAQADALILEACNAVGMAWWRRRIIFRGTRVGGWAFFRGADARAPIDPEQPLDHSPGA